MKKTLFIITALSCMFWGCSEDSNDITEATDIPGDTEKPVLGEECPENTEGYYSDDEYSDLRTDDQSLKQSIMKTGRCNGTYPVCRITMDDSVEDVIYCARCQPGEAYIQDEDRCIACHNLIVNENECTESGCMDALNRCLYASHGKASLDYLTTETPLVTLLYDYPGKVDIFYMSDDKPVNGAELEITESNNCVEFLTDSLVTDANGFATLEMKAKLYSCDPGKRVKVCLANNHEVCTIFTVRTMSDDSEIDKNGNMMIDAYETNTDGGKTYFPDHPEGCNDYCHNDSDCENFCDSAIGYRCSTRCSSNEQCIKTTDDAGKWVQMICRDDGRCAYPVFDAYYEIHYDNAEIIMGGYPANGNDKATIDWGDGTKEPIPADTKNNLSHKFAKSGKYHVIIDGDYRDWSAGCSTTRGIELIDIFKFGRIGLGWYGNEDKTIDRGTFTNCTDFKDISARDIPDATKLTNMNSMFAGGYGKYADLPQGYDATGNDADIPGFTLFNAPNTISRWDTSNVTSMYHTFINTSNSDSKVKYPYTTNQNYETKVGFNQNIGRWNTSKVTSMAGMFAYAERFNQDISCWDMSKVESISSMFNGDIDFNQNLSKWDLSSVLHHTNVFCTSSSHQGKISLKNYCMLSQQVNNEDIGRNGTACYTGARYNDLCVNDKWQDAVNTCLSKELDKFSGFTEDDITCSNLRNCQ